MPSLPIKKIMPFYSGTTRFRLLTAGLLLAGATLESTLVYGEEPFWNATGKPITRSSADSFDAHDPALKKPPDPIVADRPYFTRSARTVGLRRSQVEMGYTYINDTNDASGLTSHRHSAPETLLRFGLTEMIEARMAWNYGWDRIETGGALLTADGSDEIEMGVKLGFVQQKGILPSQAIIFDIGVQSGTSMFEPDDAGLGVNYVYRWEVSKGAWLAGSTGLEKQEEFGDNYFLWHQSAVMGLWHHQTQLFVEYFGQFTSDRAVDFEKHFLDGGFIFLLGESVQLDIKAGFGLNNQAEDFFGGLGFAVRF